MKVKPPQVYIVISCWKDYRNLVECLESVKEISYPNYRVVVVYTEPQDGEIETLNQKYGDFAQIIKNENDLGYAANCNLGISHALGKGADYILTLDSDTVVTPQFLDRLVEVAESNPKTGIAQSRIHLYYEPEKLDVSENRLGGAMTILVPEISRWFLDRFNKGKFNKIRSVPSVTLTSALIKRTVFETVGLLDPIFFYGSENFDFSFRTAKAGFKLMYAPDSVIYHRHEATTRIRGRLTPFHAYYIIRGRIVFARKALSLPSRFLYYIILFIALTPKVVITTLLVNKNAKIIPAHLRGVHDGLTIEYGRSEFSSR